MAQSHVSWTAVLKMMKQSWQLPNLQSSTAGTKSDLRNPSHLKCWSVNDIVQQQKHSILLLSLTTEAENDSSHELPVPTHTTGQAL